MIEADAFRIECDKRTKLNEMIGDVTWKKSKKIAQHILEKPL